MEKSTWINCIFFPQSKLFSVHDVIIICLFYVFWHMTYIIGNKIFDGCQLYSIFTTQFVYTHQGCLTVQKWAVSSEARLSTLLNNFDSYESLIKHLIFHLKFLIFNVGKWASRVRRLVISTGWQPLCKLKLFLSSKTSEVWVTCFKRQSKYIIY